MKNIGTYQSEEKVKAVCNYLNNTFELARRYPLQIFLSNQGYELKIDEYASQFTNDIKKMQDSATDFWAGWQAHKQSGK